MKGTSSLVSQRSAKVEILDIDRYRRIVAILRIAERNVNQEMIAASMAEAFGKYLNEPYRTPFLHATGCQDPGERCLVPGGPLRETIPVQEKDGVFEIDFKLAAKINE